MCLYSESVFDDHHEPNFFSSDQIYEVKLTGAAEQPSARQTRDMGGTVTSGERSARPHGARVWCPRHTSLKLLLM